MNQPTGHGHEPELSKLPDDVAGRILSFLDPASLLRQRCLNRSFRRVASQSSIWEAICHNFWKDKVHVSRRARHLASTDGMAAYRTALEDAQTRDYVTREELCYDPETQRGTIWSIRFKEAAGPDWTSWDPWWNHKVCRKMVFLEDGRVKMYLPRGGNGSPDQERTNDTTEGGALDFQLEQQQQQQQQPHGLPDGGEWEFNLNEPSSPMTWRFVTEPLDLPARPIGSYIRLRVGGRDVPTYCCRRSPTGNWGFVMESCWGVCASFELPPRPRTTRHRRLRRRLRRAHNMAGNEIFVQVQVDDSSEDEDMEDQGAQDETRIGFRATSVAGRSRRNDWGGVRDDDLLVSESSFNVTISLQWREAFLYNVGEDTLPEGPNAMIEFQRVYENTMADR